MKNYDFGFDVDGFCVLYKLEGNKWNPIFEMHSDDMINYGDDNIRALKYLIYLSETAEEYTEGVQVNAYDWHGR